MNADIGKPEGNPFGMAGVSNYRQYNMRSIPENTVYPQVIRLRNCVLYPPNPYEARSTTREKPLGCKTVFVSGLPEKATVEIIKEIFERCGAIETIRMTKENFCHIRFLHECVENAVYFSGYRLRIENRNETPYTGRLHVDYAQARDDQYDYDCKQKSFQLKSLHQLENDHKSVIPPVVYYTDHEASRICEKLKSKETFQQAVSILVNWLEKGQCTKRNASTFFSMIQAVNKNAMNLLVEEVKCKKELDHVKNNFKKHLKLIIYQFSEIGKIYKAASLQKCWDHFTKAQRKNIQMWKKQTEELKNARVEEVIKEREDEEMDLSDSDDEDGKNQLKEDFHKLQKECDFLRSQLEAAQNEILIIQSDHKEKIKIKDDQLENLQQSLDNLKDRQMNSTQWHSKDDAELKELCKFKIRKRDNGNDFAHDRQFPDNLSSVSIMNEARLIGLLSIFLHVHPFGVTIDEICCYLYRIDSSIKNRDVESLLRKIPTLFREETSDIGVTKWFCIGL